MKPLTSLFVASVGVSYAYYSRSHHSNIVDIVGSHDTRVLLEHLIAAASIPFLGNFLCGSDKNGPFYGFTTGIYLLTSGLWEYLQYTSRGFYQWDQTIADAAGVCLGLMALKYFQKKDDLPKEVNAND